MYYRHSNRLQNWDYSSNGYYFVTICTKDRESFFGEIINKNLLLNDNGKIVNNIWCSLPEKFDNVLLDEFQIMPNHLHGILVIRNIGRENRAPTLGQIIAYSKYQSTKEINKMFVGAGSSRPDMIKRIWQRNYYERIIRNEHELIKIRQYIVLNPSLWPRDKNNLKNIS